MAFITRQETTSKNVLDEALRDTILGGFTAQMTDEEIQMMRKIAVQYVEENRRAKSFVTALKDERSSE